MIGIRMNTFNDNSGEPEQDANSALTELDKGLRSGKVGEQCEAIVRFPRLFEKYPFPILINSSFLKLADVFRMGNNFLRLWVLRVCQQSEKHLDKILNVDEFLRRVFSVLHSNDPVARALALRTLGAVAGIIPERQNVHHAIRRGLDSHDNVEVDAAIYATTRFAAHSNAFAVAMSNKLSEMVECESTAADRRVKLVRALRTVHGGAVRAQGVLKLLHLLLEKYPSTSLVRAAISALTHIAADTVVHVPDQVEFLLSIASNDPRALVRRAALSGLYCLAHHAALWSPQCIEKLVRHREHATLREKVMQVLVECPAICAAAGSPQAGTTSPLRQYCSEVVFSTDLNQAATAAHVLTTIVVHCYEECLPVEGSELMLALESLVIATGAEPGDNLKPLRVALQCLVKLSIAEPASYAARTSAVVSSQLRTINWRQAGGAGGGARGAALLQALAALAGSPRCPPTVVQPPTNIIADMQLQGCIENPSDEGTALVLACTVVLQQRAAASLRGAASAAAPAAAWQQHLLHDLRRADGWLQYRLARAALRYGHVSLAAHILRRLQAGAASESAQRWLTALHRAADADAILLKEGISGLEECSSRWESARGWAGGCAGAGWCAAGCGGCGACTALAPAWIGARAQALAALARVASAARALCTQPPPAIAHAHAQAARDPACKAGACAGALRKAARALRDAARRHAAIASTAFHTDDSTLRHFQIAEYTYNQLAQFLERVTSPTQERVQARPPLAARTLEERVALCASDALSGIETALFDNPSTGPGITHRHYEAILAGVRACGLRVAVWPRGVVAGRAGGAACRLSVWPSGEQPAALPLTHSLALKLEGVLRHPTLTSKRQKPRQVKGVQITVTATPHPRTNEKTVELTNVPPILTAVQTVTPVRDFFSAQQLVSVPTAGLYTVAVDAAFVDEKGELWNTGPRTSLVVKAHEELTAKGTTQTARGRF